LTEKRIDLPIQFIDDNGNVTDNRVEASPCVRMQFSSSEAAGRGEFTENWFLVDTGADYIYVAPQLIEHFEAPAIRDITTNLNAATKVHKGVLATGDWGAELEVVSSDISAVHRHLGGILGRVLLANCELIYDGKRNLHTLTLIYQERDMAAT
jgi:predicted aspartyl protease